ncbi:hypothetical protein BJ684DRAFT_17341, partial [Piptocephalis cylindrospora]
MMLTAQDIVREAFAGVSLIFWSIQLVPQAWTNYKQGSTRGFSTLLLLSWLAEAVTFFSYGYSLHLAIPLLLQPQVFALVSIFCFMQYLYYDRGYTRTQCTLISIAVTVVIAAVEILGALLLLYLQRSSGKVQWVSKVFGILPTVLILLGYVSQYAEITQA